VSELGAVADTADRTLDPRVIALQKTVGWILSAVLSAGSLAGLFVAWLANGATLPRLAGFAAVWLVFNAAFCWWTQRWPAISYRHASYRIDEQGIEIRRGVYWRTVIDVPRSRVQHTDVSQGPLERSYDLGTLVVYTAGTVHARVDLAGLDHAVALQIREHLLRGQASDAV
jgi:membrane protein YdbS with pleckstrin-like domain